MKFYVYFDEYGCSRQAITEKELADQYHDDLDEFMRAMSPQAPGVVRSAGSVGEFFFDSAEDLQDYLSLTQDEMSKYNGCRSQCRSR